MWHMRPHSLTDPVARIFAYLPVCCHVACCLSQHNALNAVLDQNRAGILTPYFRPQHVRVTHWCCDASQHVRVTCRYYGTMNSEYALGSTCTL